MLLKSTGYLNFFKNFFIMITFVLLYNESEIYETVNFTIDTLWTVVTILKR